MSLRFAIATLIGGAMLCATGAAPRAQETAVEVSAALSEALRLGVEVAAEEGYHLPKAGPVSLRVHPGDDSISLKKRRLSREDADDPQAPRLRFSIAVTPKAEGEHRVQIDVSYYECRGAAPKNARERGGLCRHRRSERAFKLVVGAPKAATPSAPDMRQQP